ncbi:hypothetical protein VPH35_026485 [Triticum aestivum]
MPRTPPKPSCFELLHAPVFQLLCPVPLARIDLLPAGRAAQDGRAWPCCCCCFLSAPDPPLVDGRPVLGQLPSIICSGYFAYSDIP